MNELEMKICENVFDALDRLFDRECSVIDIYALIFASNRALGDSFSEIRLGNYAIELEQIARSGESKEFQREEALKVTDGLRGALSELLPI